MCGACGAAVPGGAFCSVCGTALGAATTASPPAEDLLGPGTAASTESVGLSSLAPVTSPPRGGLRDRWNGRAAAVLGVAGVVLASAVIVFGHGAKHTVTGDLSLSDTDFSGYSSGSSCSGSYGYDDIDAGAEVRIKDESGTLVATGTLEPGTFDGLYCVFPFTVEDVPTAKYYEISAGNDSRGGVHFTPKEMKSRHWAAHLSLG